MQTRICAIDLFSGCGGMSLGFENAGFDINCAFDHWEAAINVYRLNFSHPIFQVDLGNLNGDYSRFFEFKADVIIGGPPCQDFSHAGKRDEDLGRADLTLNYAEIVAHVKPSYFVMENVERAAKSKRFKQARDIFKNAGYGVTEKILDASLCGVPQSRKRVFLIGELNGKDGFLDCYLESKLSEKPLTVGEYFNNVLNKNLGTQYYYRHPRNYSRRAIYGIDEPSATIRGVNRPIPANYLGHPADAAPVSDKVRPLTYTERSYIQTFPYDFIFKGTKSDIEQMIGNAVPVKLAEYVAKALREYIKDKQTGNVSETEFQIRLLESKTLYH